jgi:hypothetical protein
MDPARWLRWIGALLDSGLAGVATEMLPHVKEIDPGKRQLLAWGALTLVAHKADGAVAVVYEGRPVSGDLVNNLTQ